MANEYSSSFPKTENPISETGRWTNGKTLGVLWNDVRTTPVKAFGTQTGLVNFDDSIAILSGVSGWSAGPQMVKATVFQSNIVAPADNVAEEVELLLRFSISASSATGYECTFSVKPTNTYIQINRWDGGLGGFVTIASTAGVAVGNGDVVKGTIHGKHICCYVNDVLYLEVDDATYTTGTPGIGFYFNNPLVLAYSPSDFGFSTVKATNYTWARAGCTLVNSVSLPGASTWNAGNLDNTPPSGTAVIAVIDISFVTSLPTVIAITDSAGNAWTRDNACQVNQSGYFEELSVWRCVSNGSAINNLTIRFIPSLTSSSSAGLIAVSYGGINSLDIKRFSADNVSPQDSGATTSPSVTAVADELKLGTYGDAGNNFTVTAGSGFSSVASNGSSGNADMMVEDANVSAAGSTIQATVTTSGNNPCIMGVLAYKPIQAPANVGVAKQSVHQL